MTETTQKIIKMYQQGGTLAGIAREIGASKCLVHKQLVNCGLIKTKEAELYAQGMSVSEIAKKLGKTVNTVYKRLPYLERGKNIKAKVKSVTGDRTADYVVILHDTGNSIKTIAKTLEISEQKVCRILIAEGRIVTDESMMYADGYTVEEICQRTGKTRNAVLGRLPYTKGLYDAEKPTKNAENIRKHRQNKLEK